MLKQNLIIALRHLGRQKLNTSLHLIGLTIGMSVCLLIALFIRFELSFDGYHENADRTYRIVSVWKEKGKKSFHFSTPFPLANAIRAEVTGIENVSFAHPVWTKMIEITPEKKFLEDRILAIEPEFIDIYKFEVIKGDLKKTLQKPYHGILTETSAKKFFGAEDPIGKTFNFKINEDNFEFTVGALVKDMPSNTHLPANVFVSYSYDEKFLKPNLTGWTYVSGTETFIVVPEKYDLNKVQKQLDAIADKHINSKENLPNYKSCLELQPLNDAHFNAEIGNGWVPSVSKSWIWFFGFIGLSVLVLACINFMNLSTAQALARAKEVGVRKSIGAGWLNLMGQFLLEAWLLTLTAGILSVAIAQLCLPTINSMLDKRILFDPLQNPILLMVLMVSVILIGALAGLYPGWVISQFSPTATLKGGTKVAGDSGSVWLRKGLVVTQFSISVGLFLCVILIAQQVNYLRSTNLGFNKDNIINVEIKPRSHKEAIFKNELEKIGPVKNVSFATATPSSQSHWGTIMNRTNRDDPNRKDVTLIFGDAQYCKMYGMKLLAGRVLEENDSNSVSSTIPEANQIMKAVVNEKLVRVLNFKSNEDAIGEHIWIGWNSGHVEIVGVVADFNTGPLNEAIKPALITQSTRDYEQAGIKIEAGSDIPTTIKAVKAAWEVAYPDGIFTYNFLDEQIGAFYKSEERLFNLFKVFSGLAMFISCLGLWGLATFAAQSRTKEIGIRKVLGASVNAIVLLMSKDLLILVLIAILIATPLSWLGIHKWLQGYAYKTEINWWVFGLTGLAALLIALATISWQAIKAAISNPVESLRSE